jgi:tetratricopeptide (TPR) repeat protein
LNSSLATSGLLLASLLWAAATGAQPGADEARKYFNIGAKAYQQGKYDDALPAFREAYRISQRPGLLFSMAQAHRMRYFRGNHADDLKQAIQLYREYLKQDPTGARKGDSEQALASLVPILERLEGEGAAERMTSAQPMMSPSKPRVMIDSAVPDAHIVFDGVAAGKLPFVKEVTPGKHRFTVSKPGYEDYSREISVDPRLGVPPFDVALVEKPAVVVIEAPEGAEISVDGRPQGVAPLPPISVRPGRHFVAVSMNGREPFTRDLELRRGERRTLKADLEPTGQRTAAWVLIGAGAGGMLAGGALGLAAIGKERDAQAILDEASSSGNQPASRLSEYRELKDDRDQLRLAAVLTAGAGLAVTATGVVLFVFDSPRVRVPGRDERPLPEPVPSAPAPSMEVSARPLWSPGFGGASLRARF